MSQNNKPCRAREKTSWVLELTPKIVHARKSFSGEVSIFKLMLGH